MRIFTKVVEAEGFAAAGRELGLSRSVVNRHVIDLEADLGVALLTRTTRRTTPTDTGRAFYERCLVILGDVEEAFRSTSETDEAPRGVLKVNAPMSFGTMHLSPAVSAFMAENPDIGVQLTLNDRFVDPIEEGFDVTLRIAEPVESMTLAVERVVTARRVLCASPAYLDTHGFPADPDDLRNHACLAHGVIAAGQSWAFNGPEGARSARIDGVLCSNSGEVLRDAALEGLGIALLPTFIAGSALQSGQLVSIMADYEAAELDIQLIYPMHRHLSAKVRAFNAFVCDRFGDRPYWDLIS